MKRCADCGRFCRPERHHEPPRCMGGGEVVVLCKKCHTRRHCAAHHWARWGQIGGQRTAADPRNWRRNLKQFRRVWKFDPPEVEEVLREY